MNSIPSLSGSHLRTYTSIFQHPVSHNLQWHDVHSLFRHLGTLDEETNGNFKATRNGQTLVLHKPRTKDVAEADEVIGLRRFLERSEIAARAALASDTHWLLIINHHQARIFRSEINGPLPERILPHEPDDYFRHAPHSKDFSRGQEKPEPNSFFEPVVKALHAAGPILISGTGKGMSNEMDQFVAWTKIHHPELAKRIIGSVVVDEHHLTDSQLLAKAREFYSARQGAKSSQSTSGHRRVLMP